MPMPLSQDTDLIASPSTRPYPSLRSARRRTQSAALGLDETAQSGLWTQRKNRFATDSPLEGDGFEPSVPRRNKLCVAPATNVPGRDDPLRRQLGSGCKAELDQPTTLRRVRLARIRIWRS